MKANEAPERIWIDPTNDLSKLSGHIDKDSISNDLEEASKKYSSCIYLEEVLSDDDKEVLKERLINTFKAGVEWQKKHNKL